MSADVRLHRDIKKSLLMRSLLIVLALLPPPPHIEAPYWQPAYSQTGRFHAQTTPSFAVAGVFDGQYAIVGNRVDVSIESAAIHLQNNAPYKGARQIASISVGLAGRRPQDPTTWRSISVSERFFVGTVLIPGERLKTGNIELSVPLDSTMAWSQYWLVVRIESYALDGDDKTRSRPGYSYAHTDRNLFVGVR